MFTLKSLCCLLLGCSFCLTAYAQSPNCQPAPAKLKFLDVPEGETRSFPPNSKFEFRVAPTPAGCAVTTVMILPSGQEVWLPAGKVYDSPDKSFQGNGHTLTFESHPAGEFNAWNGWLNRSGGQAGPGNCNPSVDKCPPGTNLTRQ